MSPRVLYSSASPIQSHPPTAELLLAETSWELRAELRIVGNCAQNFWFSSSHLSSWILDRNENYISWIFTTKRLFGAMSNSCHFSLKICLFASENPTFHEHVLAFHKYNLTALELKWWVALLWHRSQLFLLLPEEGVLRLACSSFKVGLVPLGGISQKQFYI